MLASLAMSSSSPLSGPEQMRSAMAAYVTAVHQAYADAAAPLPAGDRSRLPLLAAGDLTVVAVGARYLHVVATADALPAPVGQEVEQSGDIDGIRWTLRFFDPVIAPGLGLIDESDGPALQEVRETLGIRTVLYHLAVPPGSGLSPHHALHAGTGLAHTHAAAERDYSTIASLAPTRAALVHEMHAAAVNDLPVAHALLAREVAPGCVADPLQDNDIATVRKAVLTALRADGS